MNQKTSYVLAAACLITAFLIYYFKSESSSEDSQNLIALEIKAVDLYDAYENNETIADSLYKDKLIQVNGHISEVSKNNEGEYEILLETKSELGYVACRVDNSSPNQDLIVENKDIKIKGICSGLMMDVILINCSVEK
jgi:tRNA_anti-like